jgi:hypothetical protein
VNLTILRTYEEEHDGENFATIKAITMSLAYSYQH